MALNYRGKWENCPNYETDDVVSHAGELWKALQQSAGKIPPDNEDTYWKRLTDEEREEVRDDVILDEPTLIDVYHDETKRIKTTDAGEYWHVGENIARALANAGDESNPPSEDNPFVLKNEMPALDTALSKFEKIDVPSEIGVIYDGEFDETTGTLGVCGDGFTAWYFANDDEWKVQMIEGAWRGICKHGEIWVAVGTDKVCAGRPEEMTAGTIRAGKYNDCASSGGRVIAIGDGKVAWSDSGVDGWQGIDTQPGYGDGICFHELEGKFYIVGYKGCRSTETGQVFTNIGNFPANGTWRDIKRGERGMYACSGRVAIKNDDLGYWLDVETDGGGWNSIAEGEGYIVTVANGKALVAHTKQHKFSAVDVPDYLYTCVAYGNSRFWLLGSTVASALVKNINEAILNSDAPNRDNPFVTLKLANAKVAEAKKSVTEFVDEKLEEAAIKWAGNVATVNGYDFSVRLYTTESALPAQIQPGTLIGVQNTHELMLVLDNGEKVRFGGGGGEGGGGDSHNKGTYFSLAELKLAHAVGYSGDYATVVESGSSKLYVWSSASSDWTDSGVGGIYVSRVNGIEPIQGNVTLAAADVGAANAEDTVQFDMQKNVNLTSKGKNIMLKHGNSYQIGFSDGSMGNVAHLDATGLHIGDSKVQTDIASNDRPKISLPNGETKEMAYTDDMPDINSLFATPEDIEAGDTDGKIPPFSYVEKVVERVVESADTATVPDGGFTISNPPDLNDATKHVSPKYLHNVYLWLTGKKAPDIIGVALTGEYDVHGARLAWINGDYEEVEDVTSDYFDKHPAYKFDFTLFGLNEYVRIPLAYWWRGTIPSGKFSGKWGMLMSTEATDGFKPNHVAFKRNGILQDQFYWGKYRAAGKSGGIPITQSGNMNSVWKDDTYDNCVAACKKLGAGFHLGTAQEFSEILARAVVEKKTFDLWPMDKRKDYDANTYRGIHEMAYDGVTDGVSTSTAYEWRDGIRIKQKSSSSDTPYVQVYDNNGTFNWVTTTTVGQAQDKAPTEFISDQWFDNLFIGKQETSVAIDNSTNLPSESNRVIIPDRTYLYTGYTSYPSVAYSHFNAGYVYHGAFYLHVNYSPSSSLSYGFRVAK